MPMALIMQMFLILGLPKQEFDDEYIVSCLLMVFVAVSIPKLAKSESSQFKVQLDSHANNIHCLAVGKNSHKLSVITFFSHKHLKQKFRQNFYTSMKKFQWPSSILVHI